MKGGMEGEDEGDGASKICDGANNSLRPGDFPGHKLWTLKLTRVAHVKLLRRLQVRSGAWIRS
jgi:hypothetical protein